MPAACIRQLQVPKKIELFLLVGLPRATAPGKPRFMKSYFFLPSLLLCGVLLYMPTSGASEGEIPNPEQLPESQNQIINISDEGLRPAQLTMKKEDSIAFFLNDSNDALVTLAINFGALATHCSSGNLKIGDDGVIRSTKPVAPKDFASTCFHERGTYEYTVFGLSKDPQGVKGSIVVE